MSMSYLTALQTKVNADSETLENASETYLTVGKIILSIAGLVVLIICLAALNIEGIGFILAVSIFGVFSIILFVLYILLVMLTYSAKMLAYTARIAAIRENYGSDDASPKSTQP